MNPYLIEGPALISFSGGRTSAYMLHEILKAHDGQLPDDVVVAFANTGKEREETLRFVHECETRWGVRIHWIEWRDSEAGFEEVGYNSASRAGEPFAALIAKRGHLPNSVTRYCSVILKSRSMRKFVGAELGWKHWRNIIGLRHDEGHRVMRALARNDSNKEPFKAAMPMAKALHTERDVLAFWHGPTMRRDHGVRPQGFDLELESFEGNCDLCMLKRRSKLVEVERTHPGTADWWIAQEKHCASTARTADAAVFRVGDSYEAIKRDARQRVMLPFEQDVEFDAECGLWCSPDEEAA